MRVLLTAISLCLVLLTGALAQNNSQAEAQGSPAATSSEQTILRIGARYDAPPFSYSDSRLIVAASNRSDAEAVSSPSPANPNGYRGYIVQICRSILRDMQDVASWTSADVEFVEVTAQNRFEKLRTGEIDILCDPATVTRDRLSRTDKPLMASLPIYMSAVTFAAPRSKGFEDNCHSIVGVVSETTALSPGINAIIDAGNWPRHAASVRKALISGNYNEPILPDTNCPGVVIKRYETHDALAADFCANRTIYYVGDIEIIRSMIVRQGCDDQKIIAPAEFTIERYAIYTRLPEDDPAKSLIILSFLAELTRQVLDENRSLLIEVFEDVFLSGKNFYPASTALRTFFWSLTGTVPKAP